MHRAHYRLLLTIARMPKAFTYGAGAVLAIVLMLATASTVLWVDQSKLSAQHQRTMDTARAITAESDALLEHLNWHGDLLCDRTSLIHLNEHLLRSRFFREIGQLDADRRLICSTALGLLHEPVKGDYPVITSHLGRQFLNNVPLQMANKTLEATIIQHDNFNIVLSPYVTQDLYESADTVWLRTDAGLALLSSAKAPETTVSMRARAANLQRTTLSRQGVGYELVTMEPDSDLVLQTRRGLRAIAQQNGLLILTMLLGSLLIGALASGALAPYVKKLGSVGKRIRFLCDDSHIQLVYQPIFDLASLRPIGCEVLMRIKEDNGGLLMPDQAIPAILASGLASQVDHVVTRKAIRELGGRMPRQETKFQVALNYFPESIDSVSLGAALKDALHATPRDDFDLCLEVTEHSLSSELINDVRELKKQGFKIAIDDFGTGYSNLKSVTRLSPDILKIDQSFVYELEDATVRSNLIPEIINIAHAVGARAVAEGIEKIEQAALLAALGVQCGQGYALARPMELNTFLVFMQKFQTQRHTSTSMFAGNQAI